jgi:hypothetical protein
MNDRPGNSWSPDDSPHWLAELSRQHERLRRRHPGDRLLLLIDAEEILAGSSREGRPLTGSRHSDPAQSPRVLDVIRWFQIQPSTFVGVYALKSDLPHARVRDELDALGSKLRVAFTDELLYVIPRAGERESVEAAKALAPRWRDAGYRIFACLARDAKTLHGIARSDPEGEILLLHVGDPAQRHEQPLPAGAIRGEDYELAELIVEAALPKRIAYCWHGLNDEENVRQFLASSVNWGECDVQADATGERIILRHDTFRERPPAPGEQWLTLEAFLGRLFAAGRSVKIDLKEGGQTVERVLRLIAQAGFPDERLWFNASAERIEESGFRALAAAHPGAVRQVDVNFLGPLLVVAPQKAREILEMFAEWGVNRFSFSWLNPQRVPLFDHLEEWGRDANIYNVPDLESFLRAVLLLPRSLTSDFNFPRWGHYGRGSGQSGFHHEYPGRPADPRH